MRSLTPKFQKNTVGLCWVVCVLCGIAGCAPAFSSRQPVVISGRTMGTTYTVKVSRLPNGMGAQSLKSQIEAKLDSINAQMSTYRSDSELSRFNKSTSTDWFPVSNSTMLVARESHRVGKLSGGAFDVTVGPLVNLWSFGPGDKPRKVPTEAEIRAAQKRVGQHLFQIRKNSAALKKSHKDVSLDFSAIAKGFAVDEIAKLLDELKVPAYMVEIGGEVRCRGTKPNGTRWKIGIQSPLAGENRVHRIVELGEESMATSGDYRNYFEEAGQRYSHTIDPRTGRPVTHTLASVSVIHQSCMTADALATAIMVLGPDAGYNFAKRNHLAVLLLVRKGDRFEERTTPGFRKRLKSR
ncbi:MAG: FAD:protein FMN transferase [Planctomycetaceae bacterium]